MPFANKEDAKKWKSEWYQKNKERILAKSNKWKQDHRDHVLAQHREYNRTHAAIYREINRVIPSFDFITKYNSSTAKRIIPDRKIRESATGFFERNGVEVENIPMDLYLTKCASIIYKKMAIKAKEVLDEGKKVGRNG